jgi:hypothetical protein
VFTRLFIRARTNRWGPGSAEGRMTAIAACRTCGTKPLENARFCHGCGSPVDEADTRAEYKRVTVLFADVVISLRYEVEGPNRGRPTNAGRAVIVRPNPNS